MFGRFTALTFGVLLSASLPAVSKDQPTTCTCDGKVVDTKTCPAGSAPYCDCKEKKVKCPEATIKSDPKK